MTATASPSVSEVLTTKPLIDPAVLEGRYSRATKTKPIKAKPLNTLLADESILAKFLLDTLEGTQNLKAGSMVCLGEAGDVWQQPSKKVIDKYNLTSVTADGWLVFEPKPDNEVDAVEITEELCGPQGFTLEGQWGTDFVLDGRQVHLQFGEAGDRVCQSLTDPNDRWIVKRGLFVSTYEMK